MMIFMNCILMIDLSNSTYQNAPTSFRGWFDCWRHRRMLLPVHSNNGRPILTTVYPNGRFIEFNIVECSYQFNLYNAIVPNFFKIYTLIVNYNQIFEEAKLAHLN